MTLPRVVLPETLDGLAEDDPRAIRSRLDLQRVHRIMRTVSIIVEALRNIEALHRAGQFRMIELGAGDGTLMLRVARALGPIEAAVELTLLDRLALVDEETIAGYARVGWRVHVVTVDVLEWAAAEIASVSARPTTTHWDLAVANLFLHHFQGGELVSLLRSIAAHSDRLFACEPRRARFALLAAHLTGLIGANAVTREDAVLSVHAGFRANELTDVWASTNAGWSFREYSAGLFNHSFNASRNGMS